jgi:hypothetical protein
MRATQFVLSHYGAIAMFALLSYVYGRQLTRGVSYGSAAERVSLSVTLGLGVVAHLVLFVGLLRLLYWPVVLAALAAGCLLCIPTLKELARELRGALLRLKALRRADLRATAVCALVGAVFLPPVLALPLYPPTSFDATSYHLPVAKTFARSHAVTFTPFLRFQVFPVLNEMWFTLALLFYDDALAQLFQLLALGALVLAVFAFGRRHFNARAGLWAAALVLASPMVLWSGSVAYIDISLTLFVAAAVYSLANWLQTSLRHWLVLSGVFCGLAAGAKYTAFVFLGLTGLVTLYRAVRERSLLPPVIFSAAALAVAAPWYVRNYVYTRNPLFPFLPGVFGYTEWWSREDLQTVLRDLRAAHGVGRGAWALLTMPYHLAFNQAPLHAEQPWSPIYFVALPLTLAWAFRNRKVGWMLVFCLAYLVFWFYAAQILRYLLPVLPVLSLATAAAFDGLLRRLAPAARRANSKVFAGAAALALASTGWLYAVNHWTEHGPFPVKRAERDAYLAGHLPSYPFYKLLNSQGRGAQVRLYAFYDENMLYFLNGVKMGDWFGPLRYARFLPSMSDGASLYGELKGVGADYLLANEATPLPQDEFFRQHFEVLYTRGQRTLYRLGDAATAGRAAGRELLHNGGFETLDGAWPAEWGHDGEPTVDGSGARAKSGKVAVRCKGDDNVLYQSVPVAPGALYALSYAARADEPGQTARLQVNWSDARSQFLSTDIVLCEAGPEWRRCVMNVQAPEGAATGLVYTSCHERSEVWFDDFSFEEFAVEGAGAPRR